MWDNLKAKLDDNNRLEEYHDMIDVCVCLRNLKGALVAAFKQKEMCDCVYLCSVWLIQLH